MNNASSTGLQPAPAPARPTPVPGVPRRVLLVDPSVHVLHVMKSSLDRHGYEVDTALSSDVALALHREHGHAVVVVDGDGFGRNAGALVDGLRSARDDASLVVVIGGEPARDAPGASSPERWAKPVSLRYLVARLAEHFGQLGPFGHERATDAPCLGAARAPATPG